MLSRGCPPSRTPSPKMCETRLMSTPCREWSPELLGRAATYGPARSAQYVAFKLIIDSAQCIECTIDGLPIPSAGSGDGSRHNSASNSGCECRNANAAITCRLLARQKAWRNAYLGKGLGCGHRQRHWPSVSVCSPLNARKPRGLPAVLLICLIVEPDYLIKWIKSLVWL
jgi:hypothetical protein